MMKFLRTSTMPISRLRLPGDFETVKKSDDAIKLAASLGDVGLLQRPGVRDGTYELVYGTHRVAAHVINGATLIAVDIFDCDEGEVERARIIENLRRKTVDKTALEVEYLRLVHPELSTADEVEAKRGRPRTEEGKKRKQAAEDLGVSEGAIRAAQGRTAKRAAPVLDGLGREVPVLVEERARAACALIDEADSEVRTVGRLITALNKLGYRNPWIATLSDLRAKLAHELSRLRPKALCPWCSGKNTECVACEGAGYAVTFQMQDVRVTDSGIDAPPARAQPQPKKPRAKAEVVDTGPSMAREDADRMSGGDMEVWEP